MAEDVEMTPVEMTPVDAAEPPKVNPLAKPVVPGATVPGLKPGLKLPPKPGATVSALKPGLKLPPKPGATVSALKPGLKLPPKPGATIGVKPLIRKPGEGVAVAPLPKPIMPVDAQGVGKLPTVEAKAVGRDAAAASVDIPKPLETLKSVTQKLKGITQTIPPQAILHKTGIIAESATQTEAQKEASKHKTARISLSDAMGVAPVKNESAPMKTIRIKRPVNLPGATSSAAPASEVPPVAPVAPAPAAKSEGAASEGATVTQRKTLKITRPGAAVRPTGKFGIKKPGLGAAPASQSPAAGAQPEGEVADIPDLPPVAPVPQPRTEAKPGVGTTLAVVFQLAASVAVGALVWLFWESAQLPTYCGGLGWGQ